MDIKTILITGASKGIGASFSNFLASEGYRIIGIARNKDQLIKTFNSLPNQNLNHDILPIDITDFNLVKEKLSHIDLYCLINNAGIAQSNLLHEASLDVQQLHSYLFLKDNQDQYVGRNCLGHLTPLQYECSLYLPLK